MDEFHRIGGFLTDDFVFISDQMNLGKAIKSLEKADYGIITDKSNNIKALVTTNVFNDLLKKNGAESYKARRWKLRGRKLRGKWPPVFIASLTGKEGIKENYYSFRVDAPTIKAGAKGVILLVDNQVKGIIPVKDSSFTKHLEGEGSVTFFAFGDFPLGGLGGSIGVGCKKQCWCGLDIFYHSYNSEIPPSCGNGHPLKL